jgi:Tol biopolymer transport system component
VLVRTSRRAALALAAALTLAFALTAASASALPAGPRLAFIEAEFVPKKGVKKEAATGVVRFGSVDANGNAWAPLPKPAGQVLGGFGVSWDADGGAYAFLGRPRPVKKGVKDPQRVFVAKADGSGVREVAGTEGTNGPVLSADGRWVAFSQTKASKLQINPKNPKSILEGLTRHHYNSTTTWIVPVSGGRPRRLTPWADGRISTPDSFSPDGSTLLVDTSRTGAKPEVQAIDLATGKLTTVEVEAEEAAYSPDGTRIAFTSYRDRESVPGFDEPEGTSELYVAEADGTGARRITHTPKSQESEPSWDPSGERLAYLRSAGGLLGILFSKIVESNADGSCAGVVAELKARRKGGTGLIFAPTWIPGPGRGAGPISC